MSDENSYTTPHCNASKVVPDSVFDVMTLVASVSAWDPVTFGYGTDGPICKVAETVAVGTHDTC